MSTRGAVLDPPCLWGAPHAFGGTLCCIRLGMMCRAYSSESIHSKIAATRGTRTPTQSEGLLVVSSKSRHMYCILKLSPSRTPPRILPLCLHLTQPRGSCRHRSQRISVRSTSSTFAPTSHFACPTLPSVRALTAISMSSAVRSPSGLPCSPPKPIWQPHVHFIPFNYL